MMAVDLSRLFESIEQLDGSQVELIDRIAGQFHAPHTFNCLDTSDVVSQDWLRHFGNVLMIHHATSAAPFTKEKFEYGFIYASKRTGLDTTKPVGRTNRGHDLTLRNVPISLKTQADASLREDYIHISKFMELGRGNWDFEALRELYFEHMMGYERIFTLRALIRTPAHMKYELVEIPKSLLLEAVDKPFVRSGTRSTAANLASGYCHVPDEQGNIKYSLYFDGGSERKLQIQKIDKSYCIVHATWDFDVNKLF